MARKLRAIEAKPPPAERREAPKAASGSATEEELLLAVAANLDDDDPRRVYADFVAERGDAARAELIQLQLGRPRGTTPSDREEELIRKHGGRWLAPIAAVLKKGDWVFERGFLAKCTIYPRKAGALELAGHPLWSTVREAKLSETGDPAPIVTHPIMKNLRIVELWTVPRGLAGLLDCDAPIEELYHVYTPNVVRDAKLWKAFVGSRRLPRLRLVELSGMEPALSEALGGALLSRPGMRVVIDLYAVEVGPWWSILSRLDQGPEITIAMGDAEADFLSDHSVAWTVKAGGLLGLECLSMALGPMGDQALKDVGTVRRIELRVPRGGIRADGPRSLGGRSVAEIQTAVEHRCALLGVKLDVSEGDWTLRHVDKRDPAPSVGC